METIVPEAADRTDPGVTTFRGRTLEELLPQIREQLGPDAVVVRQRAGLMGGIGGFFQQRFVEVDAKAGGPRIDVYDEEPAAPEAAPEPAAAPEPEAAPERAPEPFARLLADAESAGFADALAAGPRIAAAPADPEPRAGAPEVPQLTEAGMSHAFAERLLADAEAHELPFAGGDLRAAVRAALARRIPTSLPRRAGGLAVAFAGPGSTSCADALASAYKRAGRDARAVATLDQARARLERGNPDAVLALDLPPIPSDRDELRALAERVGPLALDELLVVVPAALDLPSARALHDRLAPFAPTGIAISCEPGAALGAALELACATRLPIAYVCDGAAIVPADPAALAARLLP